MNNAVTKKKITPTIKPIDSGILSGVPLLISFPNIPFAINFSPNFGINSYAEIDPPCGCGCIRDRLLLSNMQLQMTDIPMPASAFAIHKNSFIKMENRQ